MASTRLLTLGSLVHTKKEEGGDQTWEVGTKNYMAPELKLGNESELDHSMDVYSAGIILYEIFTGDLPPKNPFKPLELAEDAFSALAEVLPDTAEAAEVFNVCKQMLERDPKKRLSASDAKDRLDWVFKRLLAARVEEQADGNHN